MNQEDYFFISNFYDLLCRRIDDNKLLSLINLRVPTYFRRSGSVFLVKQHRTLYDTNSPINRSLSACNKIKCDVFFNNIIKKIHRCLLLNYVFLLLLLLYSLFLYSFKVVFSFVNLIIIVT